jgi:transcriptional regulator GlxA family with amidase domain
MQFAMQLLLNTIMQIKHIAFEVGYDNHSKFSAAFRKNTKNYLPISDLNKVQSKIGFHRQN